MLGELPRFEDPKLPFVPAPPSLPRLKEEHIGLADMILFMTLIRYDHFNCLCTIRSLQLIHVLGGESMRKRMCVRQKSCNLQLLATRNRPSPLLANAPLRCTHLSVLRDFVNYLVVACYASSNFRTLAGPKPWDRSPRIPCSGSADYISVSSLLPWL